MRQHFQGGTAAEAKPADSQGEGDEETRQKPADDLLGFNRKPREVKEYLDRFVIQQEVAKKVLSVALCDHYHHVRLAMEGKAVIHPALTRTFIEESRLRPARAETPLSTRESEILQYVAHGNTTKEVARKLGISPHTVKTHLERIFEKLGANDRAQAVYIAFRLGLVD